VPTVFDPVRLGALELANRVVMAPMTRGRADEHDRPSELHVQYYAQRASAGLIVTEGVQPSVHGKGYCRTPGLHDEAQAAAWRRVTDAVHGAGGRIVVQLMHCGRVASHHNKPAGARTVAPSAVRAQVELYTDAVGMAPVDEPEELTTDEVGQVVAEYAAAAELARVARFDGVELHAASGYLPMQFLSTGTNRRTDRYGGDAHGRTEFVVEVMRAMADVVGSDRVGLRICPGVTFNDVSDADPVDTYSTLLRRLRGGGYAYVHVIRSPVQDLDAFALARECFDGPVVVNDGFDLASAQEAIAVGVGDAVSFARAFIANPDLVERFRTGAPLAAFDRRTLYTPGPEGYIDYPPAAPLAPG
jgi:2,4-dienoyl-CoA reductase-like NADH-dependent reductase (Old Yellow Enzyme family)